MSLPTTHPRAYPGLLRRLMLRRQRATRAIRSLRADYYRESWHHAAGAIGGVAKDLEGGLIRIDRGPTSVTVSEQATPLSDPASDRLIRDKVLIHRLLEDAGIPVPRHRTVRRWSQALAFADETGWPVVVKPARGTGAGAGVTTNLAGEAPLRRAMRWAHAFGRDVIVEEQLSGHVYRLLFLDGDLVDAIIRHPPTVVGDGVSSIRALVAMENELRTTPGSRRAQSLVRTGPATRASLGARGMNLSTVPEEGAVVVVTDIVNENRADENEGVDEEMHPSVLGLGRRVSDLTGARLIGVDVIAPTLAVGLEESGGRVLELNTPPGHFYHHMRPGGIDVAQYLLDRIFESG